MDKLSSLSHNDIYACSHMSHDFMNKETSAAKCVLHIDIAKPSCLIWNAL